MFILKAEKRSTGLKAKQLRKKGIIPGSLYGSGMEASLSLQIAQSEVTKMLKTKTTGGKVILDIEGEKVVALIREISSNPMSSQIEHLNFQKLIENELVNSTAQIVLINRDKVPGYIQQVLDNVSYRALASKLVEKIEIDLEGMQAGNSIKVNDLDIAKNEDIELLTDPESLVVSIVENKMYA